MARGTSEQSRRGRRREEKIQGRATPKKQSGRYTAPIPRSVRHSPRWYPYFILALLFLGVITTVLNYLDTLPSSPSDWYTLGGIVGILAGVLAATFYR